MLLSNILTTIFLRQTNHKNCNLRSPPGGVSWTGLYWIVRERWALFFIYPYPSCSILQTWFKKVPSSTIVPSSDNWKVGEGTSIDFEEPVVITIQCDSDGWVMQVWHPWKYLITVLEIDEIVDMNQVNEDLAFPHYLHIVDHTMVRLRHTHHFWSWVKQIMKDNCRCQNWFFKEIWRSPLQGLWTWVVNIITDTSDTFRDNVKPLFSCDARHSLPSVLQPHIWLPWRAGWANDDRW